jgi:hypothetical protein
MPQEDQQEEEKKMGILLSFFFYYIIVCFQLLNTLIYFRLTDGLSDDENEEEYIEEVNIKFLFISMIQVIFNEVNRLCWCNNFFLPVFRDICTWLSGHVPTFRERSSFYLQG